MALLAHEEKYSSFNTVKGKKLKEENLLELTCWFNNF